MNISVVLIVAAIICFVLAALSVTVGGVLLLPAGLALFAAAHLPV